MSETDLRQPDPGPLRAAAGAAELAQAPSALVSTDGYRLADGDRLAPLARDIARPMTLTLHHCARHDPLCQLGVCLLPVPAESVTGSSGITVSWTTHNLLPDWDRYGTHAGTQQIINPALGGIPRAIGYSVAPFGSGGAGLVTSRRQQDPEAGR
jgi:hypothetical protein